MLCDLTYCQIVPRMPLFLNINYGALLYTKFAVFFAILSESVIKHDLNYCQMRNLTEVTIICDI